TGSGQLVASTPSGTFTAVATRGNNEACGIRTDQTLACWGSNAVGQSAPPPGTFVSVGSTDAFGCGVAAADASVACWGLFNYVSLAPSTGSFSVVRAGGNYACAIRADQTLTCWGMAGNAVQTPPPGTFTALDAGTFFACAIATDQSLTCWGPAPPLPAADPGPTTPTTTTTTTTTPPPTTTTPAAMHTPTTTVVAHAPAPAPVKPLSATQAFTLPPAKRCVSRRRFTIHIRKIPGVTFVSAVVKVRGKRVKTIGRSRIAAPVNLTGLPKGTFRVSITAKTADGRTVTGARTYHTCAPRRHSSGPKL
ncbi:MAG TPA: hypothetical protein VNT55_09685, partial [Baekduia sp.]|nr:hypothetical protein [Baekduia sp.]